MSFESLIGELLNQKIFREENRNKSGEICVEQESVWEIKACIEMLKRFKFSL